MPTIESNHIYTKYYRDIKYVGKIKLKTKIIYFKIFGLLGYSDYYKNNTNNKLINIWKYHIV